MIVLRRSPMKRPVPPPSRARVRVWTGPMPTPRPIVAARPDSGLRLVAPVPKENALQHLGYMDTVRGFACIHCFAPPRSQFCHRDETKGQGIKTDCREGYPGCAACHHLIGTARFYPKGERRAIELLYGRLTREKVLAAGLWPARLPRWPG